MAMLLIVGRGLAAPVEAVSMQRLGRLGITSLSILESPDAVAVLLQGWAFDVETAEDRVIEILGGGEADVVVFHPVVQAGVTPREKGDGDEREDHDDRDPGRSDEPDGSARVGAPASDRHHPQRG